MKPGWKTTEFWTTSFAQILALLAFVGVLTPSDSQTLGEALAKAVAAVFTLFVNGTVVIHYVQSRLALKAAAGRAANGTATPGATLPLWIAVVLVPLLFAPSPHASLRACGVSPPLNPPRTFEDLPAAWKSACYAACLRGASGADGGSPAAVPAELGRYTARA